MAIKYDTVIIFGPTGATGSAAAAEAAKRGAKVWLAMRDTSKPIKTLDESVGSFERVQADLSDPASVKAAVQKSGAKAAYTYQIHGTNGMKETIHAMKEGGIEYVVFLSSFTIFADEDIRKVSPERIVPYAHSSVEVTIEDAGLAMTSLRPGAFAYNTFDQNVDRSTEPWKVVFAASNKSKGDGIVPRDIGRVGGACLVDRPNDGAKEVIYLFGPEMLTRVEQLEIAKKVAGKEIDVDFVGEEEFVQSLVKHGIPEFFGQYLGKADRGQLNDQFYGNGLYEEGVANVKKYSGTEATTFEQFCKEYLL